MAYYTIDPSPVVRGSHAALIGPPLLIAMVFCFSFVLLQPHKPSGAAPAASNTSTPIKTVAQPQLPALSFAPVEVLTPIAAAPASESSPVDTGSSNIQASKPQPSTATGTQLQAAASNQQSNTLVGSVLNRTKTTLSLPSKPVISVPKHTVPVPLKTSSKH